MENKYYIPKIEEFHVGFEYEQFEPVTNTWNNQEIFWIDENYTTQDILNDLKENALRPIIVKYLDREDIESLGWEIFNNEKDFYTFSNRKDSLLRFDLKIEENNRVIIWEFNQEFKRGITFFVGIIKNKSELVKLMKQLSII